MEAVELDVGTGARAFSTMRGNPSGCPTGGAYDGFNVCHYTGDEAGHVVRCREELARYVGVSADRLVIPRQTHSVNVATVGERIPDLEGVDALVTRREDVALVVNTADCLPIALSDGRHGVVGVAHGGWRGLYDGIVEATVEAMVALGGAVGQMRAAIGPCICGGCYEVDEAFAERFAARFGAEVCIPGADGGKPHVDLRRVAVMQLEGCGIAKDRIAVAGVCSKCDERFFSARRLGVESGRIATVVRRV